MIQNIVSGSQAAEIAVIDALVDEIPSQTNAKTWNATALAAINAEVDTALNSPIPATPTTLSVNDLVQSLHHSGVHVLATGTFTTDSTTVPADTSRTEKTGFFDHCWLVPTAGTTAYQPRRITAYSSVGGVFTMATGSTFSAAPGLVAYEIWSAPDFFIIGRGIFTTSSTSAPVDTGRMEITGYWNGQFIMPLEGACAFLACPVSSFTAGGTFNLATGNVFPAAPGLVHYAILSYAIENAAGANSTSTATAAASIGNKADTAVTTVGTTASILAYIKGLLDRQARELCTMLPRSSAISASLEINTVAADLTLGTITLAGLPTGATVTSAYLTVTAGSIRDDSGATNYLVAEEKIQMNKDAGAYSDAITLPINSLKCTDGNSPGALFVRSTNMSALVTGNGTYIVKLASADAFADHLYLETVQCHLQIEYSL